MTMTSQKKYAITGGIGSGKSFVAHRLTLRGIGVYDCDAAAKHLMKTSPTIRWQLTSLIGSDAYIGDNLNKQRIAAFLLSSENNSKAINDIVHPAVVRDFMQSEMQWMESAILFESGVNKRIPFEAIVCVAAPLEVRLKRIITRDGISHAQALEWIGKQSPQEDIMRQADYTIINDGIADIDLQIDKILNKIKP